ncbi:cytochrome oxidase putative small subunit CydP [Dyella sp. C11]|uniref:cytochrome oxidase putative small subunit CydP n=1 Tax=Dyella sp. C11 TaxID=2126991 RepID=UPI001E5E8B0F|nr:cytochrome oxidase putative small subunit CydP [Dyella sp. C11]
MTKTHAGPVDPVPVPVDLPRPPLRRLARELIFLVVAKIAFISLIWWAVAAHYARPDTRPAAIEHLLAPAASSSSTQADSP